MPKCPKGQKRPRDPNPCGSDHGRAPWARAHRPPIHAQRLQDGRARLCCGATGRRLRAAGGLPSGLESGEQEWALALTALGAVPKPQSALQKLSIEAARIVAEHWPEIARAA